MRNISVFLKEDEETKLLGSFIELKYAEIFVEALIEKGYDENKIIYEF